jgi:hypothetical protein
MNASGNGDAEPDPGQLFAEELYVLCRRRVAEGRLTGDQAVCGLAAAFAGSAVLFGDQSLPLNQAADKVADIARDAFLAFWFRKHEHQGEA